MASSAARRGAFCISVFFRDSVQKKTTFFVKAPRIVKRIDFCQMQRLQ